MLIRKVYNQKLNFGIGRDCTKTRQKNLFRTSLLLDYKVFIFQTGIGILEVYLIGYQSQNYLLSVISNIVYK